MITRRKAIRLAGSATAAAWSAQAGLHFLFASSAAAAKNPLAPGAPMSPERVALIDAFENASAGLDAKFEKRTHKSDWTMPYRLFRPDVEGKAPLVMYLHGSGGLGDDNEKQLGQGNVFGTRVWALPENQKKFPCFVLAPQTDRGWIRYDPAEFAKGNAKIIPGLGDGGRLALEIIDVLRHELRIDDRRIYVVGQSMGGAGVWNVMSNRPRFFAAAVTCCGSRSADDGTGSVETPLWNFHGDADDTVPVSVSRDRIAARRKAGGRPLHTEYAGVGHNVWRWAFTEPELVKWMFAQRA